MDTLVPAFVLHTRDYRDTSLLIEFLTPEQGRTGAIAKGARRVQRGVSQRAILQPLQPLWIECGGRGELKSLRHAEVRAPLLSLRGHALFSALYVNELLTRLLHRDDPQPQVFAAYETTLQQLANEVPIDVTLRLFELRLLEELGYGFSLVAEGESGAPIRADCLYRFDPQRGLLPVVAAPPAPPTLAGRDLLDFARGTFTDSARRSAKVLCRLALSAHLGDKPLQTRALFAT